MECFLNKEEDQVMKTKENCAKSDCSGTSRYLYYRYNLVLVLLLYAGVKSC